MWLRQFLTLPNGIPSHDTFGRVFSRIDAEAFQAAFLGWVQAAFAVNDGQVVAIDGKQLRRSHDKRAGKSAINRVSAWATDNHLTLGQRKVDDKSNEITAIPKLLEVLSLKGCIVTIDAMGCQKTIAQAILDQHAAYVLSLKENQGQLYQNTVALFAHCQQTPSHPFAMDYAKTTQKGHGRIDIRQCWTIATLTTFPTFAPLNNGRACSTWSKSVANGGLTIRSALRILIIFFPCTSLPSPYSRPSAPTGRLKTHSTECSMSPFVRMSSVRASATARKISLTCAILPLICLRAYPNNW